MRNTKPKRDANSRPLGQVVRTAPDLANPVAVAILVLAIAAVFSVLYVGKEVAVPIALAIVLKLLLTPLMDFFQLKLRFPTPLAALVLIIGLFCATATLGFAISGPASGWVTKAPEVLPSLKNKIVELQAPIEYLQEAFKGIEKAATPTTPDVPTVAVASDKTALESKLAWSLISVLALLFTTMIVLFFLLVAGDRLLNGLIEVLPRFSDKRKALDIAAQIQRQIGGYLFTISIMNTVVGLATGFAMWACGLGDPVLWGVAAFMLNYVPILGPFAGVGMFLLAGIVVLDWPLPALLPSGIYLLIHIAEGEIITPMLLAKRFTLNPALVIVSLFVWYALWGVPGALLAVPLLAMLKIICDRIETLQPLGHILGA
jgi:predicted PurR-regulated permease PerM